MPWNGSGTFTRVYNWTSDANNSINPSAARFDTEDDGFATGLTNCLTRDGQAGPTTTLSWTQRLNLTLAGGTVFQTTGNVVMNAPSSGTTLAVTGTNGVPISGTQASGNSLISMSSGAASGVGVGLQAAISGKTYQIGVGVGTGDSAFNIYDSTRAAVAVGIGTNGNVTVNAPTSGTALAVTGVLGGTSFTATDGSRGFYIGHSAGNVTIGTSTGDTLNLATSGVSRFTINTSGVAQAYETVNSINALKNVTTYESGSFTGTLTGCTTSPTQTIEWFRVGNIITLRCNAGLSATSNANTLTITGGPANINQGTSSFALCRVTDNGTAGLGVVSVSGGTLTFGNGAAGAVFTTSGTKGIPGGWTCSYAL